MTEFTIPGISEKDANEVADILQKALSTYNDLHLTLKHVHWNVVAVTVEERDAGGPRRVDRRVRGRDRDRWISARVRPIDKPANPFGARSSVSRG